MNVLWYYSYRWDATEIMTTHSYQTERSNVVEANTALQKIVIKSVVFISL